ncbi:MAG TPA: hypothetical protein VMU48_17905 [Terracidiphilus sp.]|nr:hypothetical protein [Terracidiphilus sp.]
MYWANRKSEFYGTRLDSLGPIRLRFATFGLSVLDFVTERLTAGSIFNLMPEELEYQDYQPPPGPVLVRKSGNGHWRDLHGRTRENT